MTNICKVCGLTKKSKFCIKCNKETNSEFGEEFNEAIKVFAFLRNLAKSRQKVGSKPEREVEQYVANKDANVVSEFERIRALNKPTIVIHRLWRRFGNTWRKVHEHKK